VPLIRLVRLALSHAAAALLAASLVASCETTTDQAATPARNPATAADVSVERVILQAYRAIGDRHLYEPDFRKMSVNTYQGFAATDPALSLQPGDKSFTVMRDGREVLSRPTPEDPTDGRAWGGMLAELFAASVDSSPVLQQTERGVLIKGAMSATTKQLDKNSRYADPDEAKDNRFQRDGGGGIGVTVERTDDKKIMIRAVQDGSPAAKGGLQAGDQVIAIDGELMTDATLGDIVHKLRGPVGAPVTMTILRLNQGQELVVAMRRSRIIPTTVSYKRLGNIALIHLTGFNSATTETLVQALDKARSEIGRDLAGIILDMRSNRGGLLDQAQAVSEVFIGDGVIFSTQGRHPDSQRTYKSGSRKTAELPMVVLVNGNSASAAEIVAAALQDRGRAAIVGTTSYGKGTVQTVVRLPNEGELVLTWSRLLAPSGYTWNELGVMPNICTAKITDLDRLGPEAVDGNRALLQRWHAERNPGQQEVANMRKICPPGDEMPDRDVDIASRLLRDPTLYAHAVRSGSIEQAAVPRP
jgi:carboxyl-terminal processing protease